MPMVGPPWFGYTAEGKRVLFGGKDDERTDYSDLFVTVNTLSQMQGCSTGTIFSRLQSVDIPRYRMPITGHRTVINLGEFYRALGTPVRVN